TSCRSTTTPCAERMTCTSSVRRSSWTSCGRTRWSSSAASCKTTPSSSRPTRCCGNCGHVRPTPRDGSVMHTPENAVEENRHLRRAMRDLVALSTLPAVWTGLGPDGIVRSLADVLLNALSLDLIYARLGGLTGGGVVEVVRDRHGPDAARVEAVKAALAPALGADRSDPPSVIPDPSGAGTLHVAVTRFGIAGDTGVLVAASRRADFPSERDRLLLSVGANQTVTVVQRRRAEEELREQQERLRTTLACIGDAVIATDRAGHITTMNGVAESLTGWATEEATGQALDA